MAETTPGPLILVTQFVGMLAGLAEGGTGTALLAGALTLWVTFVPCFIWIFAGAPLIDWLAGQPRLQAALSGITAAVVGVHRKSGPLVCAACLFWRCFQLASGRAYTRSARPSDAATDPCRAGYPGRIPADLAQRGHAAGLGDLCRSGVRPASGTTGLTPPFIPLRIYYGMANTAEKDRSHVAQL